MPSDPSCPLASRGTASFRPTKMPSLHPVSSRDISNLPGISWDDNPNGVFLGGTATTINHQLPSFGWNDVPPDSWQGDFLEGKLAKGMLLGEAGHISCCITPSKHILNYFGIFWPIQSIVFFVFRLSTFQALRKVQSWSQRIQLIPPKGETPQQFLLFFRPCASGSWFLLVTFWRPLSHTSWCWLGWMSP